MSRYLSLFFVLVLMTGCASALSRTTQTVNVETPGAFDAICFLHTGEFKYKVNTPGKVQISNTGNDLELDCRASGNRRQVVKVPAKIKQIAYANVLNGFIGMAFDDETGGMYKYPERIVVDFTHIKPVPSALPEYQILLRDNPYLANMEEFRPGRSALQSDRYEAIPTLQKRKSASDSAPESSDVFTPVSSNTGSSSDITESYTPSAGSSDSLTRQMNPDIFRQSPVNPSYSPGSVSRGSSQSRATSYSPYARSSTPTTYQSGSPYADYYGAGGGAASGVYSGGNSAYSNSSGGFIGGTSSTEAGSSPVTIYPIQ